MYSTSVTLKMLVVAVFDFVGLMEDRIPSRGDVVLDGGVVTGCLMVEFSLTVDEKTFDDDFVSIDVSPGEIELEISDDWGQYVEDDDFLWAELDAMSGVEECGTIIIGKGISLTVDIADDDRAEYASICEKSSTK